MKVPAGKTKDALEIEWFYLKILFVLVSFPVTMVMAFNAPGCPFPTGICKLYSFAPLFTTIGKPVLAFCFFVLCLLYILEKKMLFATFFLSLLSCIIISRHESNGVFFRATVLTTIWIAQFMAYLFYRFDLRFDIRFFRFQYVIQIIAATYMLAGIAKLKASGLDWIYAGDTFPIQVIKNYAYLYFDTGSTALWEEGRSIAYFLLKHHGLIRFFLAVSLALELFCMFAALGTRLRIVFAIGLLLMHLGIATFMGIGISIIAKPMIVFFINPLYRLRQIIKYVYIKMRDNGFSFGNA